MAHRHISLGKHTRNKNLPDASLEGYDLLIDDQTVEDHLIIIPTSYTK